MTAQDLMDRAQDVFTVRRVFGEPYERDGITVIPAAAVLGGGGGGGGEDAEGSRGDGGGFGVTARPVGAFVIHDGDVDWQPTVDVNRIVVGGQLVAIVALLVIRSILRKRARRSG